MPTVVTEKNASGRKWSAGPYVRKAERGSWDRFYHEFADELRLSADYPELSADYPEGAKLTDQQIDVLAYNCAYRAIWALRD